MQLELFEIEGQPAPCRPLPFSPFKNVGMKRKAKPTYFSPIPRNTNIAALYRGCELQGLEPFRQSEEIAALLEAKRKDGTPRYRTCVILVPRRGRKTTSIWDDLLGRCDSMPGYKIVTTAQDGTRARNRFREVQRALDKADFEGKRSSKNRRGKLRWANGDEAIEWDNGSRIWVVPPDPAALRGEAADVMLFDEAGELDPTKTADLVAGALPLMDTRPQGQVIITGTPAEERAGLLWDTLERARANPAGSVGILDYSAKDDEATILVEDDGTQLLNEKLLERVHPGIGTLTTIEIMRERFESMPLQQFEREYLCRFPFDANTSALNQEAWRNSAAEGALPPRPDRVGLAYDVAPDSSTAALMAAWRDETGQAHIEVLAYEPGTLWLPAATQKAWRKHKGTIAYDLIGANQEPADQLHRKRVGLNPLNIRAMQGAAARFAAELERGNITHYSQPDLDRAVEGAAWRNVGDGGRLFARKASTQDVCPVVGASAALWAFDQMAGRSKPQVTRVGGRTP